MPPWVGNWSNLPCHHLVAKETRFSRSLEIAKHGPLFLMLSEMAGCPVRDLWHLRGTEASAEVKRLAPRERCSPQISEELTGGVRSWRDLDHCGKKSSRHQKNCFPSILHCHCQTQHGRGEVLLGRKGNSLAVGSLPRFPVYLLTPALGAGRDYGLHCIPRHIHMLSHNPQYLRTWQYLRM